MSTLFRENAVLSLKTEDFGKTRTGGLPEIWMVCCVVMSVLVTAIVYVGSSEYVRKIPVSGYLDSNHAKQVIASNLGQLTELLVAEGDQVEAGQQLGRLIALDASEEIVKITESEKDHWLGIRGSIQKQHRHEQKKLASRLRQIKAIHALVSKDLGLQENKVVHLDTQLLKTSTLKEKGYISNLDWINFQTALITEKQKLNRLQQEKLKLSQQLLALKADVDSLSIETSQQLTEVDLQLSAITKQQLHQERQESQQLIAPISGTVTRIDASPGDTLKPGETVLYVGAEYPELSGTLVVPSHASGFLTIGQELQLEVDAFPSEEHGRLSAILVQLSNHNLSSNPLRTSYLARLQISEKGFEELDLKPGMNFSSNIPVARKTIFAWALDPVKDWIRR